MEVAHDEEVAVKRDHAELVSRTEQFRRTLRRLLGHFHFVTAHRAGLVDDEHHPQRGLFLFLLEVRPHRQDFFEYCLVVAPQPERLIAAEHHEPATQVLHIRPRQLHLSLREACRGDVRQRQQLVILQVGQRLGHPLDRPHIDLDLFLLQRPNELLRQLRIAFDQQHARLARREDEPRFRVVVEQRVGLQPADLDRVLSQPLPRNRLLKPEPVLARFQFASLTQHLVSPPKDLDQPLVLVVRVDDDLDVERLAFANLRGHLNGCNLHLGVVPHFERDGINRNQPR